MPAIQRGHAYPLGPRRWGLRYYDENGVRRRKSPFASKSAALAHYREVIEPRLRGEPEPVAELTFGEFVPIYLERHAAGVRPRTITTLRERLGHRREFDDGEECRCATCVFGHLPLRDLERMSGEIASWQAKLPERWRHDIMQALRQALEAAVRWGHMGCNPAKLAGRNPQPAPRPVRAYTHAELDALAAELSARYTPLPKFASSTGLRPEEWGAAERCDVDRRERILNVRRTISSGEVVELAKTARSRRQVPLSRRALEALDELTPRLDTPLLFAAPAGGPIDLHNFRNREWAPAVEASGVRRPARIYDLRSTFASNALAAGVSVFELARVMGTSVQMIERHYGALLDGAGADITRRIDAFDAEQEREEDERRGDV
jgi:integrase